MIISVANFLPMSHFDNLFKEAGARSQCSPMSISLIDSVMAFGYQAYLAVTQRFIDFEERSKANCYSRIALRRHRNVLSSSNTLLKLQASRISCLVKGYILTTQTILAMVGQVRPLLHMTANERCQTTVAEYVDENIYSELLTGAVSCGKALNLEVRDCTSGGRTSSKDRDLVRKSLWYLYSIEVIQSVRRGLAPVRVSSQYTSRRVLSQQLIGT